jgi:hypothetical protein
VADRLPGGVVHADGDEVRQVRPVGIEHPDRAILGADELDGHLGDVAERDAQIEVGVECAHGVEQAVQPRGVELQRPRVVIQRRPGLRRGGALRAVDHQVVRFRSA